VPTPARNRNPGLVRGRSRAAPWPAVVMSLVAAAAARTGTGRTADFPSASARPAHPGKGTGGQVRAEGLRGNGRQFPRDGRPRPRVRQVAGRSEGGADSRPSAGGCGGPRSRATSVPPAGPLRHHPHGRRTRAPTTPGSSPARPRTPAPSRHCDGLEAAGRRSVSRRYLGTFPPLVLFASGVQEVCRARCSSSWSVLVSSWWLSGRSGGAGLCPCLAQQPLV
jgi:hypothetical protein